MKDQPSGFFNPDGNIVLTKEQLKAQSQLKSGVQEITEKENPVKEFRKLLKIYNIAEE